MRGFGEFPDNSDKARPPCRTPARLLERLHGLRCGRDLPLVRICIHYHCGFLSSVLILFLQVWHHQHHWLWPCCQKVEIGNIDAGISKREIIMYLRYAMANICSDSYVTINHATKTIAKSR